MNLRTYVLRYEKNPHLLRTILPLILFVGSFVFSGSEVQGQKTVKLYPSFIRVQVGKTKTITAAAYDVNGRPVFDAPFQFLSDDNGRFASLSPVLMAEDDISVPSLPPPNLRTISGLTAGRVNISATWSGVTSNPLTVVVDDPALPPTAVVSGDNDELGGAIINTRVGEAIELSGEASQGVDKIEWNWGDGDRTTDLLSATHAYLAAGSYFVTLQITNSGRQTASTTIRVNVAPQSQPTRIVNVSTIDELLTAYNNATGGEHIVIPAGTILEGEIILPARSFTDYVTIRSSAVMPNIKERVSPDQPGLVTFKGTYGNAIPLTIKNGATKIRLVGLKFEPKNIPDTIGPSTYYLVQIGEAFTQSNTSQNPSKIILEHCVVNPPDHVSVVHAILNDGYKVSLISNWLGNIQTLWGQDSQAVVSYDGRGAHVYNNNFLEAASENVMYGGVVPSIEGLTSSNIEIRRCYFSKRLSWRVYNGDSHLVNVKNLFETKNARRIYMEGSVLENHWDAYRSQLFALVFKSATSPGGTGEFVPWAISEDIVLENNKISHIYGGVTNAIDNYGLGAFRGLKPNNIILKNNLFDDLSYRWGSPGSEGGARFVQPNNVEDLQFDHTTVIDRDRSAGTAIVFVSNNNFRFKMTNSIFGLSGYGIIGSGVSTGIMALNPGTRGVMNGCLREANASWELSDNVMPFYGNDPSCYPAGSAFRNSYPNDFDGIGFADLAGGNYELSSSSIYKRTSEGGTDPGANITLLNRRTACSVSGSTASCLAPETAQSYSVAGRVTNSQLYGVSKATIEMTDAGGFRRTAMTNGFGYYSFENVPAGQYVFSIKAKGGRRSVPETRSIFENTSNVDLVMSD